mmetsp:Transcript_2809/g.8568  ORF Transcript_2809/g.8568 Transcript_2809/m.8568 type:complete len:204 (+) Transcript_2809:2298-2909(+)
MTARAAFARPAMLVGLTCCFGLDSAPPFFLSPVAVNSCRLVDRYLPVLVPACQPSRDWGPASAVTASPMSTLKRNSCLPGGTSVVPLNSPFTLSSRRGSSRNSPTTHTRFAYVTSLYVNSVLPSSSCLASDLEPDWCARFLSSAPPKTLPELRLMERSSSLTSILPSPSVSSPRFSLYECSPTGSSTIARSLLSLSLSRSTVS